MVMKQDVKCSRCGFIVHGDDPLYDNRKKRHVEGRHTPHKTISERDGKIIQGNGMGNIDIGKVNWITIW